MTGNALIELMFSARWPGPGNCRSPRRGELLEALAKLSVHAVAGRTAGCAPSGAPSRESRRSVGLEAFDLLVDLRTQPEWVLYAPLGREVLAALLMPPLDEQKR